MICRGGDDTQKRRGAKRVIPNISPLESLGAAASKVILHSAQYLRRNSNEGTSGQYAPDGEDCRFSWTNIGRY